jgi:5-methylcytosine-specific restriction endonuclease McrA
MPKGQWLRTEEFKKKLSKIHKERGTGKWLLGRHHSEERKRKNSLSHKGILAGDKNPTKRPEVRKKISETMKKNGTTKGKNNPMYGKIKEKSPNWRGGISFEPYSLDWTNTLRRAIRERDNYICRLCGQYGQFVHHINYDKKNCNPNNLITLCKRCHGKTNTNRNKWISFFGSFCGQQKI